MEFSSKRLDIDSTRNICVLNEKDMETLGLQSRRQDLAAFRATIDQDDANAHACYSRVTVQPLPGITSPVLGNRQGQESNRREN